MQYDVIVIGSGPGGYICAIRCAQLGLKTAIIEKYKTLGGTCLNVGCIPSKALLDSSEHYHNAAHSFAEHGIKLENLQVDLAQMIARKSEVVSQVCKGVEFLMKKNKIDVIQGYGKLLSGSKVEVTEASGSKKTVEAKHIILATGARSRELPNVKLDGKKVIGYREAMVMAEQPKSMVVMGSGAIGCEFAYFYNSMGTKVTIVEFMPNILPIEDEEVSKEVAKSFKKSGIEIMTSASVESVDTSGKGCKVKVKTATGMVDLEADVVLSAVGIQTNLENLGLESVGVKTDKGKVVVDDYYATNIKGVYAIGDIVKGPALAHVASAEGIICVEKIAGHHPEPLNYNNIPGCTYCSPEVASVGYTEKAAKEAGYEIKVGKFPFSASGKASAAGAKEGFVKVIFDAKYGELLGAHMVGANVTEMIAEIVAARKLETTGMEIIKTVHPHPTMSEAVMEAAAQAYGECIHL